MAIYKVPQDVEADDKLLGPFTFRQFIYLFILAGLLTISWFLLKIFPLLALIPMPLVLLFGALALPIRKDQPMETYLAAVISFYLKPRKRFWIAGERDTTIKITAPKTLERPRKRSLSSAEASYRLSFLANVVDSEGYSVIPQNNNLRQEYLAEANAAPDFFDNESSPLINQMLANDQRTRHLEVVNQIRGTIAQNRSIANSAAAVTPTMRSRIKIVEPLVAPAIRETLSNQNNQNFIDLANNPDYSIQTIQSEANRIANSPKGNI